jgi:hypothetical protein
MKSGEMIGLLIPEIVERMWGRRVFSTMQAGTCVQHVYITSQVPAEDGFADSSLRAK